jgi:hypothetical protein
MQACMMVGMLLAVPHGRHHTLPLQLATNCYILVQNTTSISISTSTTFLTLSNGGPILSHTTATAELAAWAGLSGLCFTCYRLSATISKASLFWPSSYSCCRRLDVLPRSLASLWRKLTSLKALVPLSRLAARRLCLKSRSSMRRLCLKSRSSMRPIVPQID